MYILSKHDISNIKKIIIYQKKTIMKTIKTFRAWLKKLGHSETEMKQKQSAAMPKEVKPGMFVYADGLISEKLISDRQVKAVVGYVEKGMAYAVCLQQIQLPWSSCWFESNITRNMTDGKKATCKILEIAQKDGRQAEAAQWCFDYAENGVQAGEAFLPSLAEWEKVFANKTATNTSLQELNIVELRGYYWSSTEGDTIFAKAFGMHNGLKYCHYKNYNDSYVRPILAIQI